MKLRLDKLLVERGMVPSRERASSLILAGRVLVDEQKLTKAGSAVEHDAVVRLLGEDMPYVSRGGLKLAAALERWQIQLGGVLCADIGASTGGFTDCMLQHGAAAVVAVDTGYGQMAVPLRDDPRIRLLERTNARHLEPNSLHEAAQQLNSTLHLSAAPKPDDKPQLSTTPHSVDALAFGFFAMDVSFISATLVLPAVLKALAADGEPWRGQGVVLVKPQFEAGREWIGKGGIVRDPEAHRIAIERVRLAVADLGAGDIDVAESPITGAEGNREFLLHADFN